MGVGRVLAKSMAIVWKDVVVEFRAKEILAAVLIFAALVALIFGFAFDPVEHDLTGIFPGLMWVAYFFAGTLGLNRSFITEKQNDALQGLVLAPGDRSAIFLGKFLANWLFMTLVELILTPVFFALLNVSFKGGLLLAAVLALATVGFTAAGTFLSGLAANTRASEVLLPILLFPLLVPVVIGAVRATAGAMAGDAATAVAWLRALAAYDAVFVVVPFLVFEYLLEG